MRVILFAIFGLMLCAGNAYPQNPPADKNPLADKKPSADKKAPPPADAVDPKEAAKIASYEIGSRMGTSMKEDGVDIDLESLIAGIRDGIKGAKPQYTPQQVRAAMTVFQREMQAKARELQVKEEEKMKAVGDKNLKEGKAFLDKNKSKKGIKATESGLQYEVIASGKGATPKATDTVKVHYEGTLLDGTVFDSSIKRDEPAVFPVRGVIKGWTEALQLMKVGDKWKIYLPSDLAYGSQGAGGDIGPNAVLTFEVELLGIEPPARKNPLQDDDRNPLQDDTRGQK